MALRYSCLGALAFTTATPFLHGLTNQSTGAAIAPTEWFWNLRGAPIATAWDLGANVYLTATPTTTALVLACASGASATSDVFCSATHSIVQ
jgi:hypothetical protein